MTSRCQPTAAYRQNLCQAVDHLAQRMPDDADIKTLLDLVETLRPTPRPDKPVLTSGYVRELFIYNDGCLYWRVTLSKSNPAGTEAGSIKDRYQRTRNRKTTRNYIGINKHTYPRAVLVWLLFNDGDTTANIEHINGNTLDDRIENLTTISGG